MGACCGALGCGELRDEAGAAGAGVGVGAAGAGVGVGAGCDSGRGACWSCGWVQSVGKVERGGG